MHRHWNVREVIGCRSWFLVSVGNRNSVRAGLSYITIKIDCDQPWHLEILSATWYTRPDAVPASLVRAGLSCITIKIDCDQPWHIEVLVPADTPALTQYQPVL